MTAVHFDYAIAKLGNVVVHKLVKGDDKMACGKALAATYAMIDVPNGIPNGNKCKQGCFLA